MSPELKYAIVDTDLGWMGILGSGQRLLATTLPQNSSEEVLKLLGDKVNHAAVDLCSFEDLIHRLRRYFQGYRVTFPDKVDLAEVPPFHRRAWETARFIPFGETRSYGWVAEQVGNPGAARAVGQAMARNRLPIIVPCHRVVASDGGLGGFGGRLGLKRYLLDMEAMADI